MTAYRLPAQAELVAELKLDVVLTAYLQRTVGRTGRHYEKFARGTLSQQAE